jgi:hypothetical protein
MKKLIFASLLILVAAASCKKDKETVPAPTSSGTYNQPDPNAENFNPVVLGTYIAVTPFAATNLKDTFSVFQIGDHYYMDCPYNDAPADHDTLLLHAQGTGFWVPADTLDPTPGHMRVVMGWGSLHGTDMIMDQVFGIGQYHFTKQ